jgi:hypothetical protein
MIRKGISILMDNMTMKELVYPLIAVEQPMDSDELVLRTTLRKEHEGIWYKWKFVKRQTYYSSSPNVESLTELINRFHSEVYFALLLGIIDPKLLSMREGKPIFEVDDDQTPEIDRLKAILKL